MPINFILSKQLNPDHGFPRFSGSESQNLKNRKIKNCLLGMFSSRLIKKYNNFQKSGNFVFLDDFRVR